MLWVQERVGSKFVPNTGGLQVSYAKRRQQESGGTHKTRMVPELCEKNRTALLACRYLISLFRRGVSLTPQHLVSAPHPKQPRRIAAENFFLVRF